MRSLKLSTTVCIGALLVVLAIAPSASAAGSSVGTYGGNGSAVAGVASGDDPGSGTGATSSSGSLPFTGLDVGLIAGGGLVLLLMGIGMARITPARPSES